MSEPFARGRVAAARGDPTAVPELRKAVNEYAALGLRLGGANRYGDVVENRPIMGSGRAPDPHDITAAVDLSRDVTWLLAGLLVLAGTGGAVAGRRRRPVRGP